MSFIPLMPQTRGRLERGDDSRSVVEEIISQDYGSDDSSLFAAWPWADFDKAISKELIAQNVRCILPGAQNSSKVRAEGRCGLC